MDYWHIVYSSIFCTFQFFFTHLHLFEQFFSSKCFCGSAWVELFIWNWITHIWDMNKYFIKFGELKNGFWTEFTFFNILWWVLLSHKYILNHLISRKKKILNFFGLWNTLFLVQFMKTLLILACCNFKHTQLWNVIFVKIFFIHQSVISLDIIWQAFGVSLNIIVSCCIYLSFYFSYLQVGTLSHYNIVVICHTCLHESHNSLQHGYFIKLGCVFHHTNFFKNS